MGLDYDVYVGPYIECKVTKISDSVPAVGCVNEQCIKFKMQLAEPGSYCSACGDMVGSFPIVVKRDSVDSSDLLKDDGFCNIFSMPMGDMIERVMDTRDIHVYIPNEIKAPGCTFDPRSDFDIRGLNPKSLVYDPARWKAQVDGTSAYKAMVAAYGVENIKFQWGVINWAN